MKKEIIIIGDIEMGGGTLTDDFISDKTLSELIISLVKKKDPVDLILNGDTFDFLKCPYIKDGKKYFPRHISEDISMSKLGLIYKAHKKVFDALQKFVKDPTNTLYFLIGNHDHDLFFPGIQQSLQRRLQGKDNIRFSLYYKEHSIHAEHGHQYDLLNKVNPKDIFLHYKKERILKFPWVAYSLMNHFMDIKEKYPFSERIRPRQVMFAHNPNPFKSVSLRSIIYFFKSVFYYPLRYFYDPTYEFPKGLFFEFYRRFKKIHWDVDEVIHLFKKKNKKIMRKTKLFVLGHVHETFIEQKEGWAIIHPDTWRDEYILDNETKKAHPKSKKYVHAIIDGNEFSWNVVEYPIKRSIIDLNDIENNELDYIKQAAEEEGYTFTTSLQ